jgi:hypothetical protein
MTTPRSRLAVAGGALALLSVAGIGLVQAAPPDRTESLAVASDARLRPARLVVHGTITVDHPKDGLVTLQLDGGSIAAVDADSITIAEKGGTDVTVAIGAETRIRIGVKRSTVADLKVGQKVRVVSRVGDDGVATAKRIVVPPGGV